MWVRRGYKHVLLRKLSMVKGLLDDAVLVAEVRQATDEDLRNWISEVRNEVMRLLQAVLNAEVKVIE